MKKIILGIIVLVVLGGAVWYFISNRDSPTSFSLPFADKSASEKLLFVYPDEYTLQTNEIPAGFQLRPIDDEARKIGFTANPGFLNNPELFKELYRNADSSKMEKLFVSVYAIPGEQSTELGIHAVKYSSEEALTNELEKIIQQASKRRAIYLKDKDILVVIWADSENYMDEIKQISNALKIRLDLTIIVSSEAL